MNHRLLFSALVLVLFAGPLFAAAPDCTGISKVFNTDPDLDGELTTVRIANGLARPVHITHAPGDNERLFVIEQSGAIRLIKNDVLLATPFMDLDPIINGGNSGERGLLGLVFHPDYQNNGFFFVYYTAQFDSPISTGDIVVARYERDAGNADLGDDSTGQVIITVPHSSQSNHNGGMIAFGPDGYLYIGTGDGGSGCDPGGGVGNAQNLSVTLGKLMRIDPFGTEGVAPDCEDHGGNYTIPADNPFVDGFGGDCDEIWAYGLRNPWRWSFDRVTDALYIGDVGQNVWEEVDCAPSTSTGGENYGWVNMEGDHCPNPSCGAQNPCPPAAYLAPIREFSLSGAPCAVVGGYVYQGCRMDDLQGTYFYSDACDDFVRTFRTGANCNTSAEPDLNRENDLEPGGAITISSIVSFGEDNRGEMYIADLNGEVFKILPNLDIMELAGPNAAPLLIDGSGGFSWEDLQTVSGHKLRFFKVYRGDDATGPFACIHKQLSTFTTWVGDLDEPSSGEVFFYLMTAQDAVSNETTGGAASDGSLRVLDPDETGCPL